MWVSFMGFDSPVVVQQPGEFALATERETRYSAGAEIAPPELEKMDLNELCGVRGTKLESVWQ